MSAERERQELLQEILVQRVQTPLLISALHRRENTERLALCLDPGLGLCLAIDLGRQVESAVAEIRLETLHPIDLGPRTFPRPGQFDYLELVSIALHLDLEVLEVGRTPITLVADLDGLNARHPHP